jgi:hypothetical protein
MRLFFAMMLAGAAFGQTAKSFDVASVKPANCAGRGLPPLSWRAIAHYLPDHQRHPAAGI